MPIKTLRSLNLFYFGRSSCLRVHASDARAQHVFHDEIARVGNESQLDATQGHYVR